MPETNEQQASQQTQRRLRSVRFHFRPHAHGTAPAEILNEFRDSRLNHKEEVFNFNQGLVRPSRAWTVQTQRWIREAAATLQPWTMGRVAGTEQLRDAVAQWRGEPWRGKITRENVLITPGANVAWNLVLQQISTPGDSIALTSPYFFNHAGSIERQYRTQRHIKLDFDDEQASLSGRSAHVLNNPKVRALLLSNPHNPTGVHFARGEINAIERLCSAERKWLIIDESYGALTRRDAQFCSTGKELDLCSTIVIGSLTKSLALGDIRVGYIIARKELIERLVGSADDEYICISQLSQHVATSAIYHRALIDEYITRSLETKRHVLESEISRYPSLTLGRGSSAVFAWIKLPIGIDAQQMSHALAKNHGVLFMPGDHYGAPGYIRIAYGMCDKLEEIRHAVRIIARYLNAKSKHTPRS